MKGGKMFKKLMSVVLVAAMVCGVVGIMPVSAASVKYDKKLTAYLIAPDSADIYTRTNVASISIKNATAKPKKVKSSNTDVVSSLTTDYDSSSKTATISFQVNKKGTSNVTFKINGVKYTSKVTVKSYTVPATTIKISGVSSGKNLVSKAKNNAHISATLKKTTKNASLTVKAKSGWKLTKVSVTKDGIDILSKTLKSPTSKKKTYDLGTLKKSSSRYTFKFTFVNSKNGGEQTLTYFIS